MNNITYDEFTNKQIKNSYRVIKIDKIKMSAFQ